MSLIRREECEARCRVCGRRWYVVVSWVNIPEEVEERCDMCGGRAQLYPWRGESAT